MKLIVKAKLVKHVTEYYELDCTGMTMEEVNDEMKYAYIEDRSNWEYVQGETDHSEIDMTLVIK